MLEDKGSSPCFNYIVKCQAKKLILGEISHGLKLVVNSTCQFILFYGKNNLQTAVKVCSYYFCVLDHHALIHQRCQVQMEKKRNT